jgi:hypothetical protein
VRNCLVRDVMTEESKSGLPAGLRIESFEAKGRCVIADRDFLPGDEVLREEVALCVARDVSLWSAS